MAIVVNGEKIEDSAIKQEVERLRPDYERVFAEQDPKERETQLLDWPNGKKDAPDAIAMAVKLLEPFAPMAAQTDLSKDSMPPLRQVFGRDWRKH